MEKNLGRGVLSSFLLRVLLKQLINPLYVFFTTKQYFEQTIFCRKLYVCALHRQRERIHAHVNQLHSYYILDYIDYKSI